MRRKRIPCQNSRSQIEKIPTPCRQRQNRLLHRTAAYGNPFPFMNDEHPPYNPCYIKTWTLLSIVLAVLIFGMLALGDHFLLAGKSAWDLIRWLASPVI